jgi:DNA polymerase
MEAQLYPVLTRIPLGAASFLPRNPRAGAVQLRHAASVCRGCPLYKNATQVVFGEGKTRSPLMLIGEQPGDLEDLQGRPFVGPAGKLLDQALTEVKLNRSDVYITNAVKHFKWQPSLIGNRRLHSKPNAREVKACFPWLEREILHVKPQLIVCLGVTAGQALFGNAFRLAAVRGTIIRDTQWAPGIIATVHPSAILRIPDHDARALEYQSFLADLRTARAELEE